MAITVELPALGESVVEGTITKWLVKEGDRVERDQPLVEISTDKVDAEIPAPEAGVIERILAAGRRDGPGRRRARDDRDRGRCCCGTEARCCEAGGTKAAKPAAAKPTEAKKKPEPARSTPAPPPRATPVAKRAATRAGVDLRDVEATGLGGRVTKGDVARGSRAAPAASRPIGAPAAIHRVAPPGTGRRPPYLSYQVQEGDRVIPMTPLRKIVAEHMVLSKQTSPHVGTVAEIDMGDVVRARDAHKKAFQAQHGFGLTFLPFIVHATVLRACASSRASTRRCSKMRSSRSARSTSASRWRPRRDSSCPVVRDADRLSLTGLAAAIEDLSAPRAHQEALARRSARRHLHRLEPRPAREPLRLRDHQPAPGRHPADGRDREAPGGADDRGRGRAS